MHRVVPAHVARHNLVAAASVLNNVRKRVVIGVGGRFGYIYDKEHKKKRMKSRI